jgi:RNA polymerase sigma-B factor
VRDELVRAHIGLAYSIAKRFEGRGEEREDLRYRAWLVRLPGSLNERCLAVTTITEVLKASLERNPTFDDVAAACGGTRREIEEATYALSAYRIREWAPLDPTHVESRQVAENDGDVADDRVVIDSLMERLDARERQIVGMRYVGELSRRDIGQRVGFSQLQLSRLLPRSLATMQRAPYGGARASSGEEEQK